MNEKEFRQHAHDVVDWMADYLENIAQYPVRAQCQPNDILAQLPILLLIKQLK